MDSDDKKDVIVVSLLIIAASTVLCGLVWCGIVANNNDHNFDVKCIESNKAITYITLNGDSMAHKVCK